MRVLIGTEEIASLLSDLATGFRELGHEVTTYVTAKNKFYTTHKYDIVRGTLVNDIIHYGNWKFLPKRLKDYIHRTDKLISIPYLKWKNKKLINEHDLFIFLWSPWLHESYLFPLLKEKGKKIICLHVGSDVRYLRAFEQQYNMDTSGWGQFFQSDNLNRKIEKIRYHELYADLIYSLPDQAGLYLREYNHFWLPLSKDKRIAFNIPSRKHPLIIHAPSRSEAKGTSVIIKTFEKLKQDGYDFEYQLIQNMPNDKLLKLLSDADILCDELYAHGPGMLSAEAMASGCAVATRCLNVPPFQPPVCPVTPANLYEKLKLLITDVDYRVELATAGKKFVDDSNDPIKIAGKMIEDLIQNTDNDYSPEFFMKAFKLPVNIDLTKKTKNLTKHVIEKYGLQQEAIKYELENRALI